MSDIVINRACPVGCAGTPEAQQRLRELETQCAEFQKSYLGAMDRTGKLLAELERLRGCFCEECLETIGAWPPVDGHCWRCHAFEQENWVDEADKELKQVKRERDAAMDAGMDLTRRLTDEGVKLEQAKADNGRLRAALHQLLQAVDATEAVLRLPNSENNVKLWAAVKDARALAEEHLP